MDFIECRIELSGYKYYGEHLKYKIILSEFTLNYDENKSIQNYIEIYNVTLGIFKWYLISNNL